MTPLTMGGNVDDLKVGQTPFLCVLFQPHNPGFGMGGLMHNEVPPPPNIRGRGRGGNIRGRGRGRGFGGANHGGGYMNAGEGPFSCHLLAYSRNDCVVPFLGRLRVSACNPVTCLFFCRCWIWKLWVQQQFGHSRLQ